MESTFAEDLQNGLQNGEVLPDKEEAETLMKEPVQKSFEKLQKGIKINAIRDSNAEGRRLGKLVVIFVGGTGGIGRSTAKELFLRTRNPRAYIVGRDDKRGTELVDYLKKSNPDGEAFWMPRDISVLRNVDEICADIKKRETKIHCLFLTAGYMTLNSRTETVEGVDRKMCVNYYSRVKWTLNLMPLLQNAARNNELSRVITVLGAGSEGDVLLDDMDLKHNYSLHLALAHCVMMTDFMIEELARRYPEVSFSHSYPGTVKTGIANELTPPVRLAVKVLYSVMTPWILNVQESGERHFFQMTSKCYPSANGGAGIAPPDGLRAVRGMNGEPGSGAYLLDWDGKTCGDEQIIGKYRGIGMARIVWDHTMHIFAEAERILKKAPKRPASSDAEGSGRDIPDPIGWRPAA